MLKKWQLAVDNNEAFCALLTDLLKAFSCLGHELLIAKLNSYGLPSASLKLLSDYLLFIKSQTPKKIENVFSNWQNVETGVTQESILGPLLLILFVCGLFSVLDNTYFTSYADDNTPYTINQNTDFVTKALEELCIPVLTWLKENKRKLNLGKCHLIVNGTENSKIKLDEFTITKSKKEKLLGIIFDDKLEFRYHIENLCKKAS